MDDLLVHRILMFGRPAIGLVGRLGHLVLHAACPSSLQAKHFGGKGDLQLMVLCGPRHLLHFGGVVHFSVVWSKLLQREQGTGIGFGGLLSDTL